MSCKGLPLKLESRAGCDCKNPPEPCKPWDTGHGTYMCAAGAGPLVFNPPGVFPGRCPPPSACSTCVLVVMGLGAAEEQARGEWEFGAGLFVG